jgi:Domain of unknown function (DUF5753)
MPRQSPRLDPGDPVQALALELRILWLRAGSPPMAELGRKMSCSHSTVSAYLNGRRIPPPGQLYCFVMACDGIPADWQVKLEEVHALLSRLPAQDSPETARAEGREPSGGTAPAGEQISSPGRPGSLELRRRSLADFAQGAARKGWWEESNDLSAEYKQFIGLEYEATSIAAWNSDVVHELLQTEDYARHVISGSDRVDRIAPGMVERLVGVRMRCQQILARKDVRLTVVLDESVLLRRIGYDKVMYEQLQRLAREADRPNLTLHVLPLDGIHSVLRTPFVVFGFGSTHEALLRDVVSTEYSLNDYSFLDSERECHLYRIALDQLAQASLSPADSRQLVLNTAEYHWLSAR